MWRTTGGKHRYLLGDCDSVVADDIDAFRRAALDALATIEACTRHDVELTLGALEVEQRLLQQRIDQYGDLSEPMDIWEKLGVPDPIGVPLLEADAFMRMAAAHRVGGQ